MANKKDIVLLEKEVTEGNVRRKRWFVKTDKGEYPVVMGGEPTNMDIMIHPFYRFEPGPVHGMSCCDIRIASGSPGLFWYIRVAKSFEILSIRDEQGNEMEGITLPVGSPAVDLFRIDCPLKSVL